MNKKKIIAIVASVLAVAIVFSVLVFTGVIDFSNSPKEDDTTEAIEIPQSNAYLNDILATIDTDAPYLKTNIDGLYYKMTKDGSVSFYKFENNAFTSVESTGKYKASVTLSEQDISADITYYSDKGQIAGYGLYTAKDGEFNLYPYAFFRLTGYGSDFSGRSSKSCLLLIDTTEDDFYSDNKLYEESFIYSYADQKATRTLNEQSRTVGINGAKREDYFIFNDSVINASIDYHLFFSGRMYGELDPHVDVYRSGGSGNNKDNIRLVANVYGYTITPCEGGFMYVSADDEGNLLVGKYNYETEKTETIRTFDGVMSLDVLISGDYIYFTKPNTIYSIKDDAQYEVRFENSQNFEADMFQCDGSTFILRGYIDSRVPAAVFGKAADASVTKTYVNDFFRNVLNPVLTSDGKILFTAESGEAFKQYIF